jgi:arginyl-tRNA synthetase
MFSRLSERASSILSKEFGLKNVDVQWQFPKDDSHGDLATNAALANAKAIQKKPLEIAEVIVKALSKEKDLIEKAEVAGAGYVNVWLKPQALFEAASNARDLTKAKKTRKKDAPIIVDYCGPNIAKPLGVHHIMAHSLGQAIVNLYRHNGDNVIGWSYPGDWGTQFGKLAVAYQTWGGKKPIKDHSVEDLLKLYVKFHQEAEKKPELEDEARALFAQIEAGDKELLSFWKEVVEITYKDLEKLYKRLSITLDVVTGESFYQDKMAPVLAEAKKKKVMTEGKEGALIVEFPEESKMPPLLLQKKDGATLYATRDLAMVRYRLDTYKPSALYYVVDVAQTLHFKQLEATCHLLKWDMPEFEHLSYGRMRFADASMSTRKGTVLRLEEVLDEAVSRADAIIKERGESIQTDNPADLAEMMGVGALVYGIVSQNRKLDMVFDWDKMLSFEGNSAPYLQYTHARARSVLRKANVESVALPEEHVDLTAGDRSLIKKLLGFPKALEEARESHMPHILSTYLYQLAQDYNAFYNAEPILKAEGAVRDLRLALTGATADILRSGAELLTLRVPDRM